MESTATRAPVVPASGALAPVGIDAIHIAHGPWAVRQAVNAAATIPHCAHWEEKVGWIANFDQVAAGQVTDRHGREFSDSDVYKMLEAATWEMARSGGDELAVLYDAIVARIAAAQQPDGYLNTQFGGAGQRARYSDLEWGHELYCYGHLFQAAVARLRTGHGEDDPLAAVALRAADHICEAFGPGGIESVCGHPEVEVGLVELARATGRTRYLDLAMLFLDRRGHGTLKDIEFTRAYYQDDVPIREATVLRGHAVRALYLSAGAIDAAVERGDTELFEAVRSQFETTLARRTYLTGGAGSHHQDEGYGADFELPPDRAYCETCAGVATLMVAWRLALATGEARWSDTIERVLHNVVATSPAADGHSFFYSNPLQIRVPGAVADPESVSPRASSSLRAPWFEVSCCPNNVARTFASLGAYFATSSAGGVQIHQFAGMEVVVPVAGGQARLAVETAYPAEGEITVTVLDAPEGPWELALRIPSWAGEPSVVAPVAVTSAYAARIGGATAFPASDAAARPGEARWLTLSGAWRAGDRVELTLDVSPRLTFPDPRVDAIRGCVAVERGPLVLAAESVDLPTGIALEAVEVDASEQPVAAGAGASLRARARKLTDGEWPYGPAAVDDGAAEMFDLALIPYNTWANRGPATMRVWLPTW